MESKNKAKISPKEGLVLGTMGNKPRLKTGMNERDPYLLIRRLHPLMSGAGWGNPRAVTHHLLSDTALGKPY